MRSPARITRALRSLGLALPLGSLAATGLENGELYANAVSQLGGTTNSAVEPINMVLQTSDFSAGASLTGSMTPLNLEASGSISSDLNQFVSQATSLVEFVDNLVVNAEGIAAGTDLIVEIAWDVSGNTLIGGSSNISKRSKVQVQADGIDLDPDPNSPPPPKQIWTHDLSSSSPDTFDDFGQVNFEFLVKAGTPDAGNIRLRAVAGMLVGGPGSIFSASYTATALADLTVTFVGATNVKTTTGQTLYRWDTNAHSGLDYGMRDEDAPVIPELIVDDSTGGPDFVNLSWFTATNKYYIVETTADNTTWTPVTEVLGTGNPVNIDLFKNEAVIAYRLVVNTGNGSPNPTVVAPEMRLFQVADGSSNVRVAWLTNHWEIYQLNEVESDGNLSPLHAAVGDGGVVWFIFTATSPGQLFQIQAIQN